MAKFKIIEDTSYYEGCFHVKVKKHWWSRWKFVKRHGEALIALWRSRKGAQAYINLQSRNK